MSSVQAFAQQLANQHPENFPVALRLLPKNQRQALALIYTFARQADDFADEGDYTPDERLAWLGTYEQALKDLQQNASAQPSAFFSALGAIIQKEQLSFRPFFDLLQAFRQDVLQSHYDTFEAVLGYCQYSANPIGALVLQLAKADTTQNRQYSDAICTALQLLNFFQDVFDDLEKRNRCYLPIDQRKAAGLLPLPPLKALTSDQKLAYEALMLNLLDKTEAILKTGYPLLKTLPSTGRLGFQVRMVIYCAKRLLDRLRQPGGLFQSERLKRRDFIIAGLQALFYPFFKLR